MALRPLHHTTTATMPAPKFVPAGEIEALIAQGQPIVIHEGYALKLDEWINKHPGGKLAILHMVGRDATDEINMYAAPTLPPLAESTPAMDGPGPKANLTSTAITARKPC
jgi:hypothetical protein